MKGATCNELSKYAIGLAIDYEKLNIYSLLNIELNFFALGQVHYTIAEQ